jgi:hypothetical protein
MHSRNALDSETSIGNRDDVGTADAEKSAEKVPDIIQEARKEFGRYFGTCGSYHHLKACICKSCPSYPGGLGMFCSRGKSLETREKENCLCESCELFRKLQYVGDYFCRPDEKQEF